MTRQEAHAIFAGRFVDARRIRKRPGKWLGTATGAHYVRGFIGLGVGEIDCGGDSIIWSCGPITIELRIVG